MNKQFDRSKILAEPQRREFPVTRGDMNAEDRTFPVAFSMGATVVRWWGIETLIMEESAVRLGLWKDSPPFLMDHSSWDQRGTILDGRLENKVLRGTVKLSRSQNGQDLYQDIADGIRTKVSIGYRIHDAVEIKKESEMTEEERTLALEYALPVVRVTDWEPYEGSSVAIPADSLAGVGRNKEIDEPEETPPAGDREKTPSQQPTTREVSMPQITLSPEEIADQKRKAERERREEIEAIRQRFTGRVPKIDELAQDAIDLEQAPEVFRGTVYSRVTDSAVVDTPDDNLDLSEKDKKRYSVRKALLAASGKLNETDARGEKIDCSFEVECSEAVMAKRSGDIRGNFAIPFDMLTYRRPVTEEEFRGAHFLGSLFGRPVTRDLTVGTATAGGNLVGTQLIASNFIELLRNKTLAMRLGVMEMFGLTGNVAFPKQTAATGGGWVTEGNAPTEGNATFGQVTLSPKTYAAFTDYSRQLLLQSTPGIDLVIQNDLARVQGVAWDLAVFHGSGASGQPQGIVGTSGVGAVTGTSLAWAGVLEFESDVAAANADDLGSIAFVTTPSIRGTLKSREKATGTAKFLCEENNVMAGYPLHASMQITAAHILYGVFSTVVLGYWGALDILVDPFTASSSGTVRTTSFLSGDVGVRHPGAFSVSTNFS